MFPWQPILGSKLAKSNYSPLFVALAFRNEYQYRNSDFKKFICDDLATLVNVGPVTAEFTKVEDVRPRRYFLWNKPFTQIISWSTLPIFTKFSPLGSYLIVDYFRSKDVAMATNFIFKMGEIGRLTFICRLGAFLSGGEYFNSDF